MATIIAGVSSRTSYVNGISWKKQKLTFFNASHSDSRWSGELPEGVRTLVNKGRFKVDLRIENMDAKKTVPEEESLCCSDRQIFSREIAADIHESEQSAQKLNIITEKMLERVSSIKTGVGDFDAITPSTLIEQLFIAKRSKRSGIAESIFLRPTIRKKNNEP